MQSIKNKFLNAIQNINEAEFLDDTLLSDAITTLSGLSIEEQISYILAKFGYTPIEIGLFACKTALSQEQRSNYEVWNPALSRSVKQTKVTLFKIDKGLI